MPTATQDKGSSAIVTGSPVSFEISLSISNAATIVALLPCKIYTQNRFVQNRNEVLVQNRNEVGRNMLSHVLLRYLLSEVTSTTCVRVLVAPIPRSRSSEPKRVLVLVVQNRNEVGSAPVEIC